jgi:hypothetical protein
MKYHETLNLAPSATGFHRAFQSSKTGFGSPFLGEKSRVLLCPSGSREKPLVARPP